MVDSNSAAATDSFEDNYSDFGSDVEEIQILDELLAQVASESEERQNVHFVVTDIEDYESPRGVLLPKNHLETRFGASQVDIDAELEILHDIQARSGAFTSHHCSKTTNILTSG